MKNRIAVKVTLNVTDPFDNEIIQVLDREKNKAGFIRKATFCYIKGLGAQSVVFPETQLISTARDKELTNKLSKLADL